MPRARSTGHSPTASTMQAQSRDIIRTAAGFPTALCAINTETLPRSTRQARATGRFSEASITKARSRDTKPRQRRNSCRVAQAEVLLRSRHARPGPLFRTLHQTSYDWIPFDVSLDAALLWLIANPMIE